jgi:superfamily II DNA/RNA helicase
MNNKIIFGGVDVLIGTPNKLGEMFTTAGFNVNRLKMFIIDDADSILKLRHETKLMRMSNSIKKRNVLSSRNDLLVE